MIVALMVVVLGCMVMPLNLFKNSHWWCCAIALVAVAFLGKEVVQKLMNVGEILSWFYSLLSMGIVCLVLCGGLCLHYYLTKYLTKK